MQTRRSDRKSSLRAAIVQLQASIRPIHVFGLQGAVGRKIAQAPSALAGKLGAPLAQLRLSQNRGEFRDIGHAAILATDLRIVIVE